MYDDIMLIELSDKIPRNKFRIGDIFLFIEKRLKIYKQISKKDMLFYQIKNNYWFYNDDWQTVEFYIDKIHISNIQYSQNALKTRFNNAGGSSTISEAVSIEYMTRKFGASDFILENEIKYACKYKMCDYICSINNIRVGISVTRAMSYFSEFDQDHAYRLIEKKLNGLVIARSGISEQHSFHRSILHILCKTSEEAKICQMVGHAYISIQDQDSGYDGLKIIITICNWDNIYSEKNRKKNL